MYGLKPGKPKAGLRLGVAAAGCWVRRVAGVSSDAGMTALG